MKPGLGFYPYAGAQDMGSTSDTGQRRGDEKGTVIQNFIHSLTKLLTHSFMLSFSHSFIYSLSNSLNYLFIYSSIHSLIYPLTHGVDLVPCQGVLGHRQLEDHIYGVQVRSSELTTMED